MRMWCRWCIRKIATHVYVHHCRARPWAKYRKRLACIKHLYNTHTLQSDFICALAVYKMRDKASYSLSLSLAICAPHVCVCLGTLGVRERRKKGRNVGESLNDHVIFHASLGRVHIQAPGVDLHLIKAAAARSVFYRTLAHWAHIGGRFSRVCVCVAGPRAAIYRITRGIDFMLHLAPSRARSTIYTQSQ